MDDVGVSCSQSGTLEMIVTAGRCVRREGSGRSLSARAFMRAAPKPDELAVDLSSG